MSRKFDTRKRFLQLAYDQLNPNVTNIDGLQTALCNWYCFQYNVPPNDDKLNQMTLEELLLLRMMHQLRDRPHLAEELNSGVDSYEDWLKEQMGEGYKSIDEMIEQVEKLEQEERKFAEQLPDRIDTDFESVKGE